MKHAPSGKVEAHAEVFVLRVHEEAFVQLANGVERGSPQHQARADAPVDFDDVLRKLVLPVAAAQSRERKQARDSDRFGELIHRIQKPAAGELSLARVSHERGSEGARFRALVENRNKSGEGTVRKLGVGIEQQDETAARLGHSAIRGARESSVLVETHDPDRWKLGDYGFDGSVIRAVVDQGGLARQ